jgi:3-oxoadipate enol-lactonase
VEVGYRLDGPEAAPVLMLSNSLGTSLEMWEELLPRLTDRFRVLRYDQRGHGGSPAPNGPYSIEMLGRDALDLLDRLGLERVGFFGVSLGGMTGMWLALNSPERIDRLTLCCTSAHIPPRQMWLDRAATVRAEGMAAVEDAQLERWFTPEADRGRVERCRRGLLATEPEGYASCCEAIADHDLRGRLRSIRAPTLVVSASDDPSTPPDHGRLLADSIDGARFELVEGARHLAVVERPEAIPLLEP